MAQARERAHWQRTAAVLALIANCHRDPKRRRAYAPADFLPDQRDAGTTTPLLADLSVLRAVFVDRR
jgi:hypothetical protein